MRYAGAETPKKKSLCTMQEVAAAPIPAVAPWAAFRPFECIPGNREIQVVDRPPTTSLARHVCARKNAAGDSSTVT